MVATSDTSSLQEQIKSILRKHFKNAAIDVRAAFEERVFIVLVSPALDGKTEQEKQRLSWIALEDSARLATHRISFITAYSFEELFNIPFRARVALSKNSSAYTKGKFLTALVKNNLQKYLDSDSLIDVRLQTDCHIGVRVVSPTLNGKTAIEKNNLIREISKEALREDAELLAFAVAYSTDEL